MSKATGERHTQAAVAVAVARLGEFKLPARVVQGSKHFRVQTQVPGSGWENVTIVRSTARGAEQSAKFALKNVNSFLTARGYR